MSRPFIFGLCFALAIAGCARVTSSNLNPFNWFGSSTVVATTPEARDPQQPLVPPGALAPPPDTRELVPDITGLVIEPTADGAIIRASGVVPTQGYYNAQLVLQSFENGVLTYEMRAEEPAGGGVSVGSVASRTLNVATSVAGTTLDAVRTVRVVGDATTRIVTR
jgi:hypothetical protein